MGTDVLLPPAVNSKSERNVDSLPPLDLKPATSSTLAHFSNHTAKSQTYIIYIIYPLSSVRSLASFSNGSGAKTKTSLTARQSRLTHTFISLFPRLATATATAVKQKHANGKALKAVSAADAGDRQQMSRNPHGNSPGRPQG
jgi:hypothetical protein